jgi:type IV pilus assembly protein PilW
MKKLKGFSLIELMVASCLGLALLSAVLSSYLSEQQTYRYQEGMARLQENARLATAILQKHIRMAGYAGCSRLSGGILASTDVHRTPDSDAIVVQKADKNITGILTANSKKIIMAEPRHFSANDELIISDCNHAEKISVLENSNNELFLKKSLQTTYQSDAQLGKISTEVFFVANTGRKNSAGDPIYALYCEDRENNSPPMEMVEGVENMHFSYAVRTPEGIHYDSAEDISSWDKIVAVRVALLINSVEPTNDKLLRRNWEVTIALREQA